MPRTGPYSGYATGAPHGGMPLCVAMWLRAEHARVDHAIITVSPRVLAFALVDGLLCGLGLGGVLLKLLLVVRVVLFGIVDALHHLASNLFVAVSHHHVLSS